MRLTLLLLLLGALALPAALLASEREEPPPPPRPPLPTPVPTVQQQALPPVVTPEPRRPARPARAVGVPWAGRLVRGRALPASGPGYVTWDPIRKRIPNRRWRRYGTGRLLHVLTTVLKARHSAKSVLIGDLSRPHGGDFGPRFGGLGHASHQNGLDADVYYPRRDGRLRAARRPSQVDRQAAQELVDAFVAAGAEKVFVGPSLDLHGPPGVVQPLVHHDDHLHVRLR